MLLLEIINILVLKFNMPEGISPQGFARLSKEVNLVVKEYNWFGQYGFEWLTLAFRLGVFALIFWFMAQSRIWFFVGFPFLSYLFFGIAITGMHQSRHNGYTKSVRANKINSYIFGDFWSGESSEWWYAHHVQDHHVYTNIYGKDEDYFAFPWINRYLYLFIVPYVAVPGLIWGSFKFLWGKFSKFAWYTILVISGIIFQAWLFNLILHSWSWSLVAVFALRSLYTPVFLHLALFNHIGLEKLMAKIPWLPHQSKTTRNVKPNWFLVGMGGNAFVHRHIEHHLFPSLPNRMLNKIMPLVREALAREGYTYIEDSYTRCLQMCIKYYKELFSKGPPPLTFK